MERSGSTILVRESIQTRMASFLQEVRGRPFNKIDPDAAAGVFGHRRRLKKPISLMIACLITTIRDRFPDTHAHTYPEVGSLDEIGSASNT